MNEFKLYLYSASNEANGYRGTDYSTYIQQGLNNVEDLTEELDTAEITLVGLTRKESFAPTTKFILDIIGSDEGGFETTQTTHWVVERDLVEQPILSDDNYYTHHISLIEPSVVAQKRVVDNISATYKLKDVSLQEQSTAPTTAMKAELAIPTSKISPYGQFGYTTQEVRDNNNVLRYTLYKYSFGKYFVLENNTTSNTTLAIQDSNGNLITTEYFNVNDIPIDTTDGKRKGRFLLPRLAMMFGNDNSTTYRRIGNVSYDWTVGEYASNDLNNPIKQWTGTIISNNVLTPTIVGSAITAPDSSGVVSPQGNFIIEDYENYYDGTPGGRKVFLYRQYTTLGASAPTYTTNEIEFTDDRLYKVSITLHQYSEPLPSGAAPIGVSGIEAGLYRGNPSQFFAFEYAVEAPLNPLANAPAPKRSFTALPYNNSTAYGNAFSYELSPITIVYSSGIPYSALTLLQKAILNSGTYSKKSGVVISDINASDTPFYIDENFIDELASTQIIENFYNQKNLWQIMLEVGYYIHAIPELRFGADDKFLITFNRLGRTDVGTDTAIKMSIFNSRSVEDYVSATASYVSNMVQLGGKITEWVAPKTTAENLLISNDTAEILVSRPIIELLKITVKCNSDSYSGIQIANGATADMTEFVYERNVYNTLGIEANFVPNRSFALYYDLGKNVITGGNYQLPQANPNLNSDYAFKKVIYAAYHGYPNFNDTSGTDGYWREIKVSDFSFYVEYRTKDSVRQSHVRPDLRKYLLASKHDRCPEQVQFNNQQDVVVDSIKFGNNLYGKLIRTGNNSYQKAEWSDNLSQLKHKGELYRINGELYYVAKANHTFYATYATSELTFSKDYNELSKVVGIPSEPRFYEISEQSLIRREVDVRDFLLLTTDSINLDNPSGSNIPAPTYIVDLTHTANLIFSTSTDFAKYALTVFKGDIDTTFVNIGVVGLPSLYLEVMQPINAYSSQNTLTYSWKMIDNYSAGDQVIDISSDDIPASADVNTTAYTSLRAVKYTDMYGKSALVDFYLLGNKGLEDISQAEIAALPQSPIKTKTTDTGDTRPYVGSADYELYATNATQDTDYNNRGIVLFKDCREAVSMNYNLQLITDSDTFVLSPFVFSPNKTNIHLVLLSEEVNKLSDGYISDAQIIAPFNTATTPTQISKFIPFGFYPQYRRVKWGSERPTAYALDIRGALANVNVGHFNGTAGFTQVKALAIICNVAQDASSDDAEENPIPNRTKFVVARNLPSDWTVADKQKQWFIGAPYKTIFREVQ